MKKSANLMMTMFLSAIAAQGSVGFRLDFDHGGAPSPTQPGWEAFSETTIDANNTSQSYSGYTGLADGDITITTSGVQFTRNYNNTNTAAPDFPGTDVDRVYNDLILRNTLGNIDITIVGLLPGTYQITTHHLTGANLIETVSEFDLLVQDADSPGFSQNVGNFPMGRGNTAGPVFVPVTPSFLVTSNGTDPVILRISGTSLGGGGTPGWFGINGLEVKIPVPRIQVDFDNGVPAPPGNTQAGWEPFSEAADANNKSVRYPGYPDLAGGDITITTSGVTNTRNYNNANSAAPDFPGTDLDRVYNDLILNNQPAGVITLTIAGLKAGAYNFTTHHLTQGGETSAKSTFDLHVQDADSPAFDQNVGTFEMGRGDGATFWAATVIDFTVVSNGADPVLLRITTNTLAPGGGQGAWVGINGLEISSPAMSSSTFQVVITPNAGNPGNYDFSWNSLADKEYDLVSSTDLDTPPATWAVWNDLAGIAATPDINTLTNVPGGGNPKRFFAVVERDAP